MSTTEHWCVKCDAHSLIGINGQYEKDGRGHERLRFTCRMCGYSWTRPCADAERKTKVKP